MIRRRPIDLSNLRVPSTCRIGSKDIAPAVRSFAGQTLDTWRKGGFVYSHSAVGIMVADPVYADNYDKIWDKPELLAGFGMAWGQKDLQRRVLMDALRMMRPAARYSTNTLGLWHKERQGESHFCDKVESVEPDGRMLWGDLPFGGACLADMGFAQVLVGVGGMSESENDMLATTVAKFLSMEIAKL